MIVGHATFCIVVVYNNAVARLRRTGTSLEEASQDLGADGWQTFRNVTLPSLRSALVAGALLAFALSFDEIIVTTFTAGAEETLPIWIFSNYSRPNQLPIVNVVGLLVIVISIIPVYLANRLTQDPAGTAGAAAAAAVAGGCRRRLPRGLVPRWVGRGICRPTQWQPGVTRAVAVGTGRQPPGRPCSPAVRPSALVAAGRASPITSVATRRSPQRLAAEPDRSRLVRRRAWGWRRRAGGGGRGRRSPSTTRGCGRRAASAMWRA